MSIYRVKVRANHTYSNKNDLVCVDWWSINRELYRMSITLIRI